MRRVVPVDGPARQRIRAAIAAGVPSEEPERRRLAAIAAQASVEVGAPAWADRWVSAAASGDVGAWILAVTAAAAWLRGWRSGQWAAGMALWLPRADLREADAAEPCPCAPWDDIEPGAPSWLIDSDGSWILPPPVEAEPADLDLDLWWRGQVEGRAACRKALAIVERGGQKIAYIYRCKLRSCAFCARRALSAAVWRYWPLFGAPLLPGWKLEMFTVGNAGGILADRAEYAKWRKGLAGLERTMIRGSVECGIPAGSWRAGLAVVELVPRPVGAFVHAHVVAVRRAAYPYGWSAARLQGIGVPPRPASGWTPGHVAPHLDAATIGAWASRGSPGLATDALRAASALLGVREACRRAGLGEVSDASILDSGGGAAAAYIAKVARYIAKVTKGDADPSGDGPEAVEPEPDRLEDRPDLMAMVRGTRRVQPFGDVRRLYSGPELSTGEESRFLGFAPLPDPEDPASYTDVEGWGQLASPSGSAPDRIAWLDLRRLQAWADWCDVPALLRLLGADDAPEPSAASGVATRIARLATGAGDVATGAGDVEDLDEPAPRQAILGPLDGWISPPVDNSDPDPDCG